MPFEPIEPGLFKPTQGGQAPPRRYLSGIDGYHLVNIGTPATDFEIGRIAVGASRVIAPFAGHLMAMSFFGSANKDSGTLTWTAWISSVRQGELSWVNGTREGYTTFAKPFGFKQGDSLYVGVTTASLVPAGSLDAEVTLWVLMDIP